VRNTLQNLLKLEKITQGVENRIQQLQILKRFEEVRKLGVLPSKSSGLEYHVGSIPTSVPVESRFLEGANRRTLY
jgi:hypothetical protein